MTVYEYIKNCNDKDKLYPGIREILKTMQRYPEDWEIKKMQRLADARYTELGGE